MVEEDLIIKQEPLGTVVSEAESTLSDHRNANAVDHIKQNDIIKEAGSVILSTCYETSAGDTVVESYEETVNCVSPSSFIHVSDAEESHHGSDQEETVGSNDQHGDIIEEEIEQQPPTKKNKLWEGKDVM